MRMRLFGSGILAMTLAVTAAACGGDDSSGPSGPSGGGGGGGGGGTTDPPVATTTITITSTGASPRSITVAPGTRVTFVNNDTRPHDMQSDPHPDHTDCPGINEFIQPGQSSMTDNLNTVRTCGFHDHNDPTNQGLLGTIRIQ